MTTLLPPAKLQLFDANGAPLAGGSVYYYIPGTTTFKTTWQDSSQIAANTNPIILDAAGEAVVFGLGAYRMVVFDMLGNQIWDQLTSSTDAGGIYSGGTSTGTAANQILATTFPAGFALTAGNQLTFIAGFTSTGATTLNANGTGAKSITKPGTSGPVAIGAGDIVVGDAVVLYYDGTQFQLINPIALPLTGGNLKGALNEAEASGIAAASNIDIGGMAGNYVAVTNASGATTIFTLGIAQAGAEREVTFSISGGSVVLAHSSSIQCPSGLNLGIISGDTVRFRSVGSNSWYVVDVQRYTIVTKAIMQTGADTTAIVTPALAGQADGAAKAHCAVASNALASGSFNVASITHVSTGVYTVTYTTPFAAAGYTAVVSAEASTPRNAKVTAKATGTCTVSTFGDFACTTPSDADFDFVAFGRQ